MYHCWQRFFEKCSICGWTWRFQLSFLTVSSIGVPFNFNENKNERWGDVDWVDFDSQLSVQNKPTFSLKRRLWGKKTNEVEIIFLSKSVRKRCHLSVTIIFRTCFKIETVTSQKSFTLNAAAVLLWRRFIIDAMLRAAANQPAPELFGLMSIFKMINFLY